MAGLLRFFPLSCGCSHNPFFLKEIIANSSFTHPFSLPRPGSAVAFCVAGSAIFVSAPEVSSALREREVGRAAWALWDARALRAGVADSDFALDERRERRVDDALVGVLTVTIA